MIGCQLSREFKDRQHEGHPGAIISEMKGYASCSLSQKPDLVLIHVGTNDCIGAADNEEGRLSIIDAQNRLQDLVNYVFSQVDGVTVILSTLLPNAKPSANRFVGILNNEIRDIVSKSN